MAPSSPSQAHSESALDSIAGSQACHTPPGNQDCSSRRSRSHSSTSLGFEDGWDIELQMRSLHSYIRSLLTKADFEQCIKHIEKTYKQEITELKKDIGAHFEDI